MDYTVVRNFPRGFREKRSRGIVSFAVQGNKKIRVREERKNRRIYMRRVIERKGQKINGGRPIVCVPVMAEGEEEIVRQAEHQHPPGVKSRIRGQQQPGQQRQPPGMFRCAVTPACACPSRARHAFEAFGLLDKTDVRA